MILKHDERSSSFIKKCLALRECFLYVIINRQFYCTTVDSLTEAFNANKIYLNWFVSHAEATRTIAVFIKFVNIWRLVRHFYLLQPTKLMVDGKLVSPTLNIGKRNARTTLLGVFSFVLLFFAHSIRLLFNL